MSAAQNRTVLQALEPIVLGMPRTLFLLSPNAVKGGNYSTISRIRSHLVKHGHTCLLWDTGELEKKGDVNQVIHHHKVDLLIGIHAFRTGRILKDCKVPYVLILGGTDVNEFYKDEQRMAVMTQAVMRASYVIAFSKSLQHRAQDLWPDLPQKQMTVITQAVMTKPATFNLHRYLADKCEVEDSEDRHIFLLVGAIRPVKNPTYLMNTFSDWYKDNKKVLYVILGPVLDEDYYTKEFQPTLKRCEGIVFIPGLTFEESHAAMQQCFALVNSSESEGMSLAILEGMQLNVPVLARNIAGNSAIIKDKHTGLLFSSPEEFREKATHLISDSSLRKEIVSEASEYVTLHHSMKQEETAYLTVVEQCLVDDYAKTDSINGLSKM